MKTLKYAGRFLMRSKSYTIINLLGLAFSLACCIVLMRYIHRELTVDSHCIDPQHIIIPLRDIDGNIHPGSLEQGWSDTDSTYIPENKIVEQCRLQAQQRDNVKYENSNYAMNIMAVDSTFFHFFRYPVLTGEAAADSSRRCCHHPAVCPPAVRQGEPRGESRGVLWERRYYPRSDR